MTVQVHTAPQAALPTQFSQPMPPPGYARPPYNEVHSVAFRGGWIGFFSGESQSKAVARCAADLNGRNLAVTGIVTDRWNIFRRVLWAIVLVLTLGFVGRGPGVVIVSEPIR